VTQIRSTTDAPTTIDADALVVPLFSDRRLEGAVQTLDTQLGGGFTTVFADDEITGKKGESVLLRSTTLPTKRVLGLGLGAREDLCASALARWAGTAVRQLGKRGCTRFAFVVPTECNDPEAAAAAIVEGALTAPIETTIYRTEIERAIDLREILLIGADHTRLERGAERGRIVGEAINFARHLAQTPANDMTPTILAERAQQLARDAAQKGAPLSIDVLDEARMRELGMGALLGVSQGSDQPATLTVLTYLGDPSSTERIALVGKAITFDSGGISIKPSEKMHEMKYDMSGGAAVIATMGALAQLRPKINVIGVVPASENLLGPSATKPGDVHRAMSGKTIEIINTDAEGRLILADALAYARHLGATRLIDCATLTGACVIALGHAASAVVSNDDAFVADFLAAAGKTTERYWRMPLYDDFKEEVKSDIADLRNATGRAAGTLTAAAFLAAFAEKTPWIHLDIAGTAYTDDNGPGMAKGPTGTPVRALLSYLCPPHCGECS